MGLDFKNIELAFKHKSDKDLKKAYWLFKSLSYPLIVKMGQRMAQVAMFIGIPIRGFIKKTLFSQFCGGENIAECGDRIKQLSSVNIGTILDYSAEGNSKEKSLEKCLNEVLDTIKRAKNDPGIPFAVFKITGIGKSGVLERYQVTKKLEGQDRDYYYNLSKRLHKICLRASEFEVPVLIDAEESWIQDVIDNLVESMMEKYNKEKIIIYNTVQMYRWDRIDYIKAAHFRAQQRGYKLGLKIVRGAYMEKENDRAITLQKKSPIYDSKEKTDEAFNEAIKFCIQHFANIGIVCGTHNEESTKLLAELMKEKNLPKDHPTVHFAQLLGMSDHISYSLSDDGYNVAKYVPYGPVGKLLPYLTRRAEENTAIRGQSTRELDMIKTELKRRNS